MFFSFLLTLSPILAITFPKSVDNAIRLVDTPPTEDYVPDDYAFTMQAGSKYITVHKYGGKLVVHRFNAGTLEDEQFILINATTYPDLGCAGWGTGTLTNYLMYCWADKTPLENGMGGYNIRISCITRAYRATNTSSQVYFIKVFNISTSELSSFTETDITTGDAGRCIPAESTNIDIKMANIGYGFTGVQETPIFFMDNDGNIHRLRWDGGTVREDQIPSLPYSSLTAWQPIQFQNQWATRCFGGNQWNDCGEYIVWLGEQSGCVQDAMYVTEYKYGCSGSYWGCYFAGELTNQHTKRILGSCDSDALQRIDDFTAWHDGSAFWILYHKIFKPMYNGSGYYLGVTSCRDSECWNLYKFNPDKFDPARAYDNEDYPFPSVQCEWENQTQTGGNYTFVCDNYDVPSWYDYLYFDCGGGGGNNCNLTMWEKSDPANSYSISYVSHSGTPPFYWVNVSMALEDFQGKRIKIVFKGSQSATNPNMNGGLAKFTYPTHSFGMAWDDWLIYGSGRYPCNSTYSACPDDIASQNFGYLVRERITCSCTDWINTGECLVEDRIYERACTPSWCNTTTKYEYDVTCTYGACYPPTWYCVNATHLGYRQSDCTWLNFIHCTYGCNGTANNCYGVGNCFELCPNSQMAQRPFPDCSCECPNYCLEYLNLSVNCQCSVYPTFGNYSELQINTSQWQENPVSIFADITGGVFSLLGNILIPLIILFLSFGFASIIVIILKKTVPRI